MMKSYSQRDPLWANNLIKGSSLSIGRFGCTISSIADLSTYFGDNFTPNDINEKTNFTSGGLIIWASCFYPNFHFERREYGRKYDNILRALQDPSAAVILQVAKGTHWVVATGWQAEAKTFKIADPWLGDWSNMARYKDDITGAAYFRKT